MILFQAWAGNQLVHEQECWNHTELHQAPFYMPAGVLYTHLTYITPKGKRYPYPW